MTVLVRRASEADVTGACDVLRRSIRELCVDDHHDDEQTLSIWLKNKTIENVSAWVCSETNFAVVAVESTQVCGFGLIDRNGEIQLCYVAPELVGRGSGKSMLCLLEQQANSWGLNTVFLMSTLTAKPFYEHHGYFVSGLPISTHGVNCAFPMSKTIAL